MRDLSTIINLYKKPLQQMNLISEETSKTIFANIEMILTISTEFLNDLKEIYSRDDREQLIGALFIEKVRFSTF
jgi:hypothetical protein